MPVVITIVAAVVAGFVVLRLANNVVRDFMKRLLGPYFEYASLLYGAVLSLVGLLAGLYFLVPLVAWLAIVLIVVVGVIGILEFM